jgi:Tfp pilus assembly protein PilW
MGSRGFTLLELLVALLAGTLVLAGIASLFVYSQRVEYASQSQAFLQRQGALVMDQMTQRVLSASALATGCNGGNSLGVTNPVFTDHDGVNRSPFCFYRSVDNQLLMDNSAGTYKLLSGAGARLTVTGFTTTLNDPRVTISFQLSDSRGNAMTFSTDLTRRNP